MTGIPFPSEEVISSNCFRKVVGYCLFVLLFHFVGLGSTKNSERVARGNFRSITQPNFLAPGIPWIVSPAILFRIQNRGRTQACLPAQDARGERNTLDFCAVTGQQTAEELQPSLDLDAGTRTCPTAETRDPERDRPERSPGETPDSHAPQL